MKVVVDIEEANNLLKLYDNSYFQIVRYTDSLRRIAMRLTKSNSKNVLYVVGIGCERINGFFSLSNAVLSITQYKNGDEIETVISDAASDFRLVTSGGFSLAQGEEFEFGLPFEDGFLK